MMRFIERIGLGDGDGNLSFNKAVTVAMLAILGAAVVTDRVLTWPTVTFATTIIGAGFGLKAFLAVVSRPAAPRTESVVPTGTEGAEG